MKKILQQYTGVALGFLLMASMHSCKDSKTISSKEKNRPVGKVYVTTLDQSQLLAESELYQTQSKSSEQLPVIQINPGKTYQKMDGFGYTLTGGSAMHIHNMKDDARHALLKELSQNTLNLPVEYRKREKSYLKQSLERMVFPQRYVLFKLSDSDATKRRSKH